MDYKKLSADILELVGGEDNIASVTHCATRLRFNLKDDAKASTDKLKNRNGVMGVVNKGGQYQVVIGSDVQSVHRELLELLPALARENAAGGSGSAGNADGAGEAKGPVVRVLDTIAGIFTPIIPAITGAGMLKAVMALLVAFKWIDTASQTYQFLNFFADAAFYFLPFLLANSAAHKFKCNAYMAMSVAGVLLHPNFIGMVSAAKEAGEGLAFIGLPVSKVSYSSSVIPIILGVWFMSFVEPIADRVSPKPVKFFTKPLLTLVVTAPVTLIALGPLGNIIGEGIAAVITFLNSHVNWLVPLVVGTFTPLLVMTGMHYGLIPIGINNIATAGFDTVVGPGMLGSNIAQGGASLAVAARAKNPEIKQLAASAGITAVCGITEPAMYGVSLRFKRPLIAAMIGGGVSGLFLGITGVGRYTSGSPGLLALPGYIGTEGTRNITFAIIGAAIAFAVSFLVSFILGIEEPAVEQEEDNGKERQNAPAPVAERKNSTFNENAGEKASEIIVESPIKGQAVSLSEVNDPTFAEAVMGQGAAVIPERGEVYAPFDGEVGTVFETGHAIGLVGDNGVELLIHAGLDTVELQGRYFEPKVKPGQRMSKGQLLLAFDTDAIKREGYDIVTPIIITNSSEYAEVKQLAVGRVDAGDRLIKVTCAHGGEGDR